MAPRRILVIVPCLNEEESLPGLLDQLEEAHRYLRPRAQLDVLVVDDGSVDRTSEIAHARGVRVASLCRNLGIGAAVQTGLRLAARDGYDWAMQIDGDGQHPPAELEKLLERAEGPDQPDLVIGSRFLTKQGFQSTRMRRVGITWLSLLLRASAGIKVADPTSGFRLFGKRALTLFDEVYPYDYPEPESLAIARAANLKVVEVPVHMQERQGGASSIFGFKAAYYMVKVTLAVLLTVGRNANPWRKRR
ncbi:MAG: glycosyltransferase family 2 protein [Deltaproteobacteria bacterium]|nr:glycosyltransferase family 2 protein [Deltaproteobacteria bacterium]